MGKIDTQAKNSRDFHKNRKPNKRTKQGVDMEVDQFEEYLQNDIEEIENTNIGRKRLDPNEW